MTTADSGATYTVASEPYGLMEIRSTRSGPLLRPGPDWDPQADYTPEGKTIRIPNGKTRTFSGGPYARYVAAPGTISSSSEPTLKPSDARMLLVYRGAALGSIRLKENPSPYFALEEMTWERVRDSVKKMVYGSGVASINEPNDAWWRNLTTSY